MLLVCPAWRVGAVPLRIINILVNRKAAQVLGSVKICEFSLFFFFSKLLEIVEKFIIGLFGKFSRRFLKDIISIELRMVFFFIFCLEDISRRSSIANIVSCFQAIYTRRYVNVINHSGRMI